MARATRRCPLWHEIPFFHGQVKIVLRNCGLINPDDIEEYIAVGGYQALYKVLIDQHPEAVVEQIKAARLRGRGGAGYLTGNKWEFLQKAPGPVKYLVCNADEGDPGAYMNRNEIESDPHALLEGMLIARLRDGRHERHHLRARRVPHRGAAPGAGHRSRPVTTGCWAGTSSGRGFDFDIQLVEGAGAFVCGEETALIASLEGRAGRPRPRPPFPAQQGLYGKPTNINNVETWYNVAPIVSKGAAWFTEIGSPKSAGTKVFSLVGKVKSTGLVEMPLGTPLARFIYDVGEGGTHGRDIKAVQTGGPSGGCIPAEMFDTPVDYETLAQLGSIMGSGGMVVMDEDNCMVDVARYLRRVHALRVVRQVRALSRRPRTRPCASWTASPRARRRTRISRPSTSSAAWSATRRSAASARAPPTRCSRACATTATSSRTTSWRGAAARACARTWRSRRARTPARCT